MRYQLIPIRKTFTEKQIRVGEDVEKLEPFCIVSENVKWCSNHGSSMAAPQNLNKVPQLGIHTKELKAWAQRDICIPILITVLFAIAKRWKQPKCPIKDEWINKMCYIHQQWNVIQP